jgi:hypothetical protein
MRRKFLFSAILIWVGVLFLLPVHAQQTLGTVSGTIADPTAAAISGASMINEQTAASRTTISNGTGAYSVQDLSIGTYTVTVTAQGFDTEKLSGFQNPDRPHRGPWEFCNMSNRVILA